MNKKYENPMGYKSIDTGKPAEHPDHETKPENKSEVVGGVTDKEKVTGSSEEPTQGNNLD